jgi:hypothetical protein
MVFSIDVGFRHMKFNIKRGIVHSILLPFFQYCYVAKICTNLSVKMRGNINKEMAKRMKRRENLD